MSWKEFLSPSWWFTLRPGPVTSTVMRTILFTAIAVFFLLAILSWIFRSAKRSSPALRKLFSSLIRFGFTLGAIGLLLAFFAFQEIPFFSARFWWGLWGILAVVWCAALLRQGFKISGQLISEQKKKEEFEKYLKK